MPARRASSGEVKCIGSPPNKIRPSVGAWTPEIHLIKVDLPAPLSPIMAVISPLRAQIVTSVSACTAPNHLLTLSMSRRTSDAAGIAASSDERPDNGGLSSEDEKRDSFALIVDTS